MCLFNYHHSFNKLIIIFQEKKLDKGKVLKGMQMLLEGLGVDLDDKHFHKTPERAAKSWVEEICSGLGEKKFRLTTFPIDENYEPSMIVLQHIPVKSVCAHHLLPFIGEATVAYIPNKMLCGISKLSRIVDYFSRRPQVQEELTNDIVNYLCGNLDPQGAGVIIKATHMCMAMRGVNHDGVMTTSSLKGSFLNESNVRSEFMALAHRESLNKL